MEFKSDVMETEEYKELFKNAKLAYPDEYEFLIHLACIKYFSKTENIKSDVNIDNEIQEIHTT